MSRHLYNEHDALIKAYAPAGRARRAEQARLRQRRVGLVCSAAAASVLAGYLAVDTDVRVPEFRMPALTLPEIELPTVSLPDFSLPEFSLPEFSLPERPARVAAAPEADSQAGDQAEKLLQARELNEALRAELKSVAENREELALQRQALSVQQAELDAASALLEERRISLGSAQAELEADDSLLEEREMRIARQEDSLNSRREALERESPQLQASIDTLARQRQELDEQRQRFRAQRNLLEHEIALLQEQRALLESQQAELRDQWESLQILIQQVSDARDLLRQRQAPADMPEMLELPEGDALLAASEPVIDESELGEIRGGIDTGDQLDITIGLTRTVDVNGVEQYASALQFGDITPATAEQIGSLPPVVVQNGPGNTVESAALGAVSGSFPVIIQNTLDNQHIVNMNVLDITVGNVGSQVSGAAASSAVSESMSLQN